MKDNFEEKNHETCKIVLFRETASLFREITKQFRFVFRGIRNELSFARNPNCRVGWVDLFFTFFTFLSKGKRICCTFHFYLLFVFTFVCIKMIEFHRTIFIVIHWRKKISSSIIGNNICRRVYFLNTCVSGAFIYLLVSFNKAKLSRL
jgi:hypothetical protein